MSIQVFFTPCVVWNTIVLFIADMVTMNDLKCLLMNLIYSYRPEYQCHGYLSEVIAATHVYSLQVDNLTKHGVIPTKRIMDFVEG